MFQVISYVIEFIIFAKEIRVQNNGEFTKELYYSLLGD
jgi:hypothetical protein